LVAVKIISARKINYLLIFCGGLMMVSLLLTFSRGGYLGLGFSVMAVLASSWRYLDRKKDRDLDRVGYDHAGAHYLCRAGGQPFYFQLPIFRRLFSWSPGDLAGVAGGFLEKPVFGVGLGNYSREVSPLAVYRNPITSHNLYLDLAAETGIFGLAAWLILIGGSLGQLVRSLKRKTISGDTFLKIGLGGSLVYLSFILCLKLLSLIRRSWQL